MKLIQKLRKKPAAVVALLLVAFLIVTGALVATSVYKEA